jgi:hypothetical protein
LHVSVSSQIPGPLHYHHRTEPELPPRSTISNPPRGGPAKASTSAAVVPRELLNQKSYGSVVMVPGFDPVVSSRDDELLPGSKAVMRCPRPAAPLPLPTPAVSGPAGPSQLPAPMTNAGACIVSVSRLERRSLFDEMPGAVQHDDQMRALPSSSLDDSDSEDGENRSHAWRWRRSLPCGPEQEALEGQLDACIVLGGTVGRPVTWTPESVLHCMAFGRT